MQDTVFPLTPEQRQNIATRRAELARELVSIRAELADMARIEADQVPQPSAGRPLPRIVAVTVEQPAQLVIIEPDGGAPWLLSVGTGAPAWLFVRNTGAAVLVTGEQQDESYAVPAELVEVVASLTDAVGRPMGAQPGAR